MIKIYETDDCSSRATARVLLKKKGAKYDDVLVNGDVDI